MVCFALLAVPLVLMEAPNRLDLVTPRAALIASSSVNFFLSHVTTVVSYYPKTPSKIAIKIALFAEGEPHEIKCIKFYTDLNEKEEAPIGRKTKDMRLFASLKMIAPLLF